MGKILKHKTILALVMIVCICAALFCGVKTAHADYLSTSEENTVTLRKVGDYTFNVVVDKGIIRTTDEKYKEKYHIVRVFDSKEKFYISDEDFKKIKTQGKEPNRTAINIKKETVVERSLDKKLTLSKNDRFKMYRIGYVSGNEKRICVWVEYNGEQFIGFINADDIESNKVEKKVEKAPKKTLGMKMLVILIVTIPAVVFIILMFVSSKKYYIRQNTINKEGTPPADIAEKDTAEKKKK